MPGPRPGPRAPVFRTPAGRIYAAPTCARRRGRGCRTEGSRSGQDRSLHGTRERRIVGRCGVVSVGPRLSVAKPGSEQCLPLRGKQPHERASFAGWRRSLCAAKRSGPLRGVCAAAYSHGRIWNPPLRYRCRCSPSTRKAVPYIGRGRALRDAGEGAAGRKVPGAVKTAPYMAPVNGES